MNLTGGGPPLPSAPITWVDKISSHIAKSSGPINDAGFDDDSIQVDDGDIIIDTPKSSPAISTPKIRIQDFETRESAKRARMISEEEAENKLSRAQIDRTKERNESELSLMRKKYKIKRDFYEWLFGELNNFTSSLSQDRTM